MEKLVQIISKIQPFDDIEKQHISETLSWIKSGASIFRIQKPDIPNKHLVAYFILWDETSDPHMERFVKNLKSMN